MFVLIQKQILSKLGMIALLLVFISSCSDDSGFSLTDPELMTKYDYIITFDLDDGIYIFVQKAISSSSLTLNDSSIALNWRNASYGNVVRYYCKVNAADVPSGINFVPSAPLQYHLKINGKSFIGTTALPEVPYIYWKAFNPSNDYDFSWTLNTNASAQIVSAYAGDDDEDKDKDWELKKTERDFLINKKFWQGLNYSEMGFYVSLVEVNHYHTGSFLMLSYVERSYEWDSSLKKLKVRVPSQFNLWKKRILY